MIKKYALILTMGLVCMFPMQINAQKVAAKEDNNGLLFQISGKGLTKPSYMFGTFHILCPTDMMPMEKLTPYVDQADQLVMELDMDDPSEVMAMQKTALLTDGRTVKDVLTPEQYAKVDQMFKNT